MSCALMQWLLVVTFDCKFLKNVFAPSYTTTWRSANPDLFATGCCELASVITMLVCVCVRACVRACVCESACRSASK